MANKLVKTSPRTFSTSASNMTDNLNISPRPTFSRTRSSITTKPSLNPSPQRPTSRPRHSLGSLTNSLNGKFLRQPSTNHSPSDPKSEKPTTLTLEEFDGQWNKENIPPFRLASLTTPSPKRSIVGARYPISLISLPATPPSPGQPTLKPSIHVVQLSNASLDFNDYGEDHKEKNKPLWAENGPGHITRTVSNYEKNGKVVLRFGRIIQLPPRESSETSSTDSDDYDENSDDGSDIESQDGSGEDSVEDSESDEDSNATEEDEALEGSEDDDADNDAKSNGT